ncbi:MAG: toprim domain-containing protein [Adlercreutzia equolifaciens]
MLHVFESAIDALSYATILEHEGKQTASLGMLSLGGVSVPHARNGAPKLPLALAQHLDDRPYIASLALHLDNDEAGRRAAREIARAAASRGVAASMEPPPEGKDVNEFLLARRSRGRAPDRGR